MTYQLKNFYSPKLVRSIGDSLARVHPRFPVDAFVRDAVRGLGALELLPRARHISRAMTKHLPSDFEQAIAIIVRSLGPVHASDELVGVGMTPFFYMPHVMYVADHGLDHFELSMRAQEELTKRFTCELSIRFFLERHPAATLTWMRRWAKSPDAHVRRLVSEGTRLRLPWARRVSWLDDEPRKVLALLELLKDDPASVVRRSVANNLNDLGKVHPELLVETCGRWLRGASAERRSLVEHALRSAIKRGERGALGLLGYGRKPRVEVADVHFDKSRVRIGDNVRVTFTLRSTSTEAAELLVDLAVHFVKSRGTTTAKVFKVSRITLPARGRATLQKSVSLRVHTTRKPRPGRHAVSVLVNGTALTAGAFDVIAGPSPKR